MRLLKYVLKGAPAVAALLLLFVEPSDAQNGKSKDQVKSNDPGKTQGEGKQDTKEKVENPLDKLKKLDNLRIVARPKPTCLESAKDCRLEAAQSTALSDFQSESKVKQAVADFLAKFDKTEKVDDVIVHLVKFQDEGVQARWLYCKGKDEIKKCGYEANPGRLFGTHTLGVVFIHLNTTEAPEDIRYYGAVKKKLASNVQNLLTLLRVIVGPNAVNLSPPPPPEYDMKSLWGAGVMDEVASPSDVTLFGADNSGDGTLLGTDLVIDNQPEPWWDVTLGVPVNKLSLVEYDSDSTTFAPTELNKQTVYALFNLNPWAWALRQNPHTNWFPHPVAGLGITGRPGNTFFVGGAFGFHWAQFFIGSGFANVTVANPNVTNGGPATIERYGSRLTYGINLPVAAALKKLSAK